MKIDILTLFPQPVEDCLNFSIPGRAQKSGALTLAVHDLRTWAIDERGTVDDTPYGGGPGMILRVDVAYRALEAIDPSHRAHRLMLTPSGQLFKQTIAKQLSRLEHLVMLCGRYEGFDGRIKKFIDQELSIGPYVLSGGELAAAVISDAIIRLLPGALGNQESLTEETFEGDRLEYPQYTRPEKFQDLTVPAVLKSGHHQAIAKWREERKKMIENPKNHHPK